MISKAAARILEELLALPTAPFAERYVMAHVESFCAARRGVTVKTDPAGNLLVRVKKGNTKVRRPVCLTAHLDHPGFIADKMIGKGKLRAIWRGGVRAEYFVGSGVRFFVDGKWRKGRIKSVTKKGTGKAAGVETAVIEISGSIPRGAVGMWDCPEPAIRNGKIYARACDDLAGVAAMLCCIDRLSRSAVAAEGYFLFTRAEEVGFIGALAACRHKTIPANSFVVAVETSSELPSARMGDGPILRVGDKASIFNPAVTEHCREVADSLVGKKRGAKSGFTYQRKLMDGGTCESTAYCELGYEATGVCLALGNYHNMDTKRKRIGSEYVDAGDFASLVEWFVALCNPTNKYEGGNEKLKKRLKKLDQEYSSLLRGTKDGSGI